MERKAVSPDSSTHLTEKSRKAKKRKHKHRNKKKAEKSKKFKSSSSSVESDHTRSGSKRSKSSNESIRDLTEFLDDRKELHTLLFNIIPKKEVKEMMPDILKKVSFKEVKKLCSEQLETLTKKQLKSIITGKEMSSSDDESMEEQEKVDEVQQQRENDEERKENQDKDDNTKENTVKEGKEQDKKEKDMIIFQEMITIPNQEEIDELVEGSSATQEHTTDDATQSTAVSVDEEAELKELEFRARALESLVRARERQMKIA